MAPSDATTKSKVLVETLLMCLGRSKVKEVVGLETVGSVLTSGIGEIWRGNEFRLEMPWQVLIREPGLTEADVRPPLLVFKTYEAELGVKVRLPESLGEVSAEELAEARAAAGLGPEDFALVMERLREVDAEAAARRTAQAAAEQAVQAVATAKESRGRPKPPWVALGICAALLAASGLVLLLTLRQPDAPVDLGDVASILELADGRRQEQTITARIADRRWEGMPPSRRVEVVREVFQREQRKGVRSMTLTDGKRPLATATAVGGATSIEVF